MCCLRPRSRRAGYRYGEPSPPHCWPQRDPGSGHARDPLAHRLRMKSTPCTCQPGLTTPRRAAITILRPGIDVRAHRPRWRTDRRLGGRSPRSTFVIHCVDVDRRSLRLTAVRSSVDDLLEVTVGPLAEEMSADA